MRKQRDKVMNNGERKICKYCQSDIPKKAKVCPVCRKKQNMGCFGVFCIVFLMFIIVPYAIGSCASDEDDESKKIGTVADADNETTETSTVQPDNYHVGDIVQAKDYIITFISAQQIQSDNQFIEPADGNEFWCLEFEFENIGTSDLSISSMFGWTCYADDFTVNQEYIDMNKDLSGTISSGKHLKGNLYFEIPKDAQKIELEYKDNAWEDEKLTFIIK